MATHFARLAFPTFITLIAACSGDLPSEPLATTQEALTTVERIASFEGPISGAGADWRATTGTAVRSNTPSDLSYSMALSGGWTPAALSAALPALGALSGAPTIDVQLPSGYVTQGSWAGQVALSFTCASANIFNLHHGPVPLLSQTGVFKRYTFPGLPSNLKTALQTQSCTVSVLLGLSNSGSSSVKVDRLFLGQASGGSGGTGGTGGSAGSSGNGGTAGTSGGSGVGGSAGGTGQSGGWMGGAQGTAGAGAGGAGTGGTSGGVAEVEYFIELPAGVARESVAIAAYGAGLTLKDAFEVRALPSGFSSASSVRTSAVTELGVSADLQHLWSQPNVLLRNNALVHGNALTEGTVEFQTGAAILGSRFDGVELDPIQHLGWTIPFPAINQGLLDLPPSGTRAISAGAFAGGTLGTAARLTLSTPGIYTLGGSLTMEPSSVLDVDNRFGSVEVYLRDGFTFRGQISLRDTTKPNVLIGVGGTAPVAIDAPFRGILVAPRADVTLISTASGHSGAIYAKGVLANPNTIFTHYPFTPEAFCTPSSPCSGLCPCDPGGGCDDDGDCANGIECKHGVCGGGGNPCSTTSDCAPGLVCENGSCTDPCVLNPALPECLPPHCSNGTKDAGETDIDCGGDCDGCDPGDDCTATSDCADGLECGTNNGACFGEGKPRNQSVCWPSHCEHGNPTECGQTDSPCGSNCSCANPCNAGDPNSACPPGESCQMGAGFALGSSSRDVCLDTDDCPSDDPTRCSEWSSLCGPRCSPCEPSCAAATCTNPSDGCGGICPGVCERDDPCTTSTQCETGFVCLPEGGPGTCQPVGCAFQELRPPLCGSPGSECGAECPIACTPACEGKQCGLDGRCATSCGTCPSGTFCDGAGQCATPTADPPAEIPDEDGGEQPVEDLPPVPAVGVGALRGGFSVSEHGRPVYSVPIEVPPGRAGLEPSLSLRYTGSRMSGLVGTGWTLEGLSMITRCPRIQAIDGRAEPIKNDTTDLFCLDGKRLEVIAGTYGADGAEYRSIIDGFAKVVSRSDEGAGFQMEPYYGSPSPVPRPEQGPDWFQVFTKDGRILTYGRTRDSLVHARNGVRLVWHLNRVEDRARNTILVTYRNASAVIPTAGDAFPASVRPDMISYTGHDDIAGKRSVRFSYEQRPDNALMASQGGIMSQQLGRLSRVTTYVDDKAVKNYSLHYKAPPAPSPNAPPAVSLVEKIFECEGQDEVRCKRPTTFQYEQEEGFTDLAQDLNVDFGAVSQLDVNGDGISDYFTSSIDVEGARAGPDLTSAIMISDMAFTAATMALGPEIGIPATAVYEIGKLILLSELQTAPTVNVSEAIRFGSESRLDPLRGAIARRPCDGIPTSIYSPTYFLDYDRDGRDDMAALCGDGTIRVLLSLGDGRFSSIAPPLTLPVVEDYLLVRPEPVVFDVDGDSLEDVISCRDGDTLELRLRRSPNEGFQDPIPFPPPERTFCRLLSASYSVFDLDGDGTQDFLAMGQALRYSPSSDPPLAWQTVGVAFGRGQTTGDFNGDGLTDMLRTDRATVSVFLNTGAGTFMPRHLARPDAIQPPFAIGRSVPLDYDGDGRLDLFENWRAGDADDNLVLSPSADLTHVLARKPSGLRFLHPEGVFIPARISTSGDADGDGNVDLFGSQGVFFGSGKHNRLLTRVTDGLGNLTRISYDEAGSYEADCPASNWPEACLRRASGLVSSHEEGFVGASNTDRIERRTDHKYRNARINVTGHGWLGFERRVAEERAVETTGIARVRTTITDFELPARYGLDGNPKEEVSPPYVYPLASLPATITVDQPISPPEAGPQPLESGVFERRTRVENEWAVQRSIAGMPFPYIATRATRTYDREVPPTSPDGRLLTELLESFEVDVLGNIEGHVEDFAPNAGAAFESRRTTTFYVNNTSEWIIGLPSTVSVTSIRGGNNHHRGVTYAYDDRGLLTGVFRAVTGLSSQKHNTVYGRNAYGNIETITESVATGEAPRVTTLTYDDDNVFPRTITNPLGHVTQIDVDRHWGAPKTIVDPNGVLTRKVYDGLGLLAETQDSGGTTVLTYEQLGPSLLDGRASTELHVTSEQQGTSGTRTGASVTVFDNYGRVISTMTEGFDGTDVWVSRGYDARGRIAAASAPRQPGTLGEFTTFSYDGLDRVTRVAHPDGSFVERQYASRETLRDDLRHWLQGIPCTASFPTCVVDIELSIDEEGKRDDEVGKRDVVIADHRGLPLRSIDGENIATTSRSSNYVYGPFNLLAVARDNGNNGTFFTRDDYGRLIVQTNPNLPPRLMTYNGYDELVTSRDANGQTQTLRYDDLGRQISIAAPSGTRSWTYDTGANALGKLATMSSPGTPEYPAGQRVEYHYEPLAAQNRGLLERVDYVIDGERYPVSLVYDDLSRTSEVRYPNLGPGAPIRAKYRYDDPSGALTGVDEVGSGTPKALWRMTDAFRGYLLERETFGNGAATTYTYDPGRQFLTGIQTTASSETIRNLTYSHYRNGLVFERTTPEKQERHQYDALNRLQSITDVAPGTTSSFGYDPIGNLTQQGARTTTYRPTQPLLVDRVGGTNVYDYDLNGNVKNRAGPDIPGGSQEIAYTPFDLPRRITTGPGTSQEKISLFEYTADEERLIRRDSDVTRHFVTDLYQRELTTGTTTTREERFRLYAGARAIAEIVRKNGTDETLYLHGDHLDTVDLLSNDAGEPFTQTFSPFGAPTSSTALTRAGFTGHQHERDLDLVDMRGRLYDPLAGRFMSADPVIQAPFSPQGLNPYSYVFNNPINNTDPTGFITFNDVMSEGVKWFVVGGHLAGGALATGAAGGNPLGGIGSSAALTGRMATGGYAPGAYQVGGSSGGAGYRTPWEAARGALERYNPASIQSKNPGDPLSYGDEYGGLIYEQGGRYHFTEAVVGEEQGHVDPWQTLDKIPADARNRVVGDYHTHGGPNPIVDGEDFSGLRYGPGSSSDSLRAGSDIVEARADLATRRANILDPKRYTSYLGTPSGRFGVYNPHHGTVFSFSPSSRLLPANTQIPASAYAWH